MVGRGRGRELNLPAWMTSGGATEAGLGAISATNMPSLGLTSSYADNHLPAPGLGAASKLPQGSFMVGAPGSMAYGMPPPPPFAMPAVAHSHSTGSHHPLPSFHHLPQQHANEVSLGTGYAAPSQTQVHNHRPIKDADIPVKSRIKEPKDYQWQSRVVLGRSSHFEAPVLGQEPPPIGTSTLPVFILLIDQHEQFRALHDQTCVCFCFLCARTNTLLSASITNLPACVILSTAVTTYAAANGVRGQLDDAGASYSRADGHGSYGHHQQGAHHGRAGAKHIDRSAETRHARRLYVGNLPKNAAEADVTRFMAKMIGITAPMDSPFYQRGDQAVLNTHIVQDKNFGFIEFGSVELTAAALQLDGVEYITPEGLAVNLRLKRPNDYRPEALPAGLAPPPVLNVHLVARVSPDSVVMLPPGAAPAAGTYPGQSAGPGKVFIGGLPYNLSDADVEQLLTAFGPLKSFKLVRDPGAELSKGYGFCEYTNLQNTQAAIAGLHGIEIGAKSLTVKMAGEKTQAQNPIVQPMGTGVTSYAQQPYHIQHNASAYPSNAPNIGGGGTQPYGAGAYPQYGTPMPVQFYPPSSMVPAPAPVYVPQSSTLAPAAAATRSGYSQAPISQSSRVLKLSNMVTSDELRDQQEWLDITDDVRMECSTYGAVTRVVVPRVQEGFSPASEGLIYVSFQTAAGAAAAERALQGRKFANRIVISEYYDENLFNNNIL